MIEMIKLTKLRNQYVRIIFNMSNIGSFNMMKLMMKLRSWNQEKKKINQGPCPSSE